MNVKLEYDMNWNSCIWFDNMLQMNHYQIVLTMITNTSNEDDQITCMNRINHFIYEELNNTVFINENDAEQIQLLSAAGIKITTLPEVPIDQIIGWIVFLKLNTILEDRMVITDIKIQSDLGDNIKYIHSLGESLGPTGINGWWADSSPNHSIVKSSASKKRVVKLNKGTSWNKLSMAWANNVEKQSTANTVLFAQFTSTTDPENEN